MLYLLKSVRRMAVRTTVFFAFAAVLLLSATSANAQGYPGSGGYPGGGYPGGGGTGGSGSGNATHVELRVGVTATATASASSVYPSQYGSNCYNTSFDLSNPTWTMISNNSSATWNPVYRNASGNDVVVFDVQSMTGYGAMDIFHHYGNLDANDPLKSLDAQGSCTFRYYQVTVPGDGPQSVTIPSSMTIYRHRRTSGSVYWNYPAPGGVTSAYGRATTLSGETSFTFPGSQGKTDDVTDVLGTFPLTNGSTQHIPLSNKLYFDMQGTNPYGYVYPNIYVRASYVLSGG